jgi:hypothetical protein
MLLCRKNNSSFLAPRLSRGFYFIIMTRTIMTREVTSWMDITPSHIIGDVTARDGIQAVPWYHFPTKENRAQLARQMMQIGIPHIEI